MNFNLNKILSNEVFIELNINEKIYTKFNNIINYYLTRLNKFTYFDKFLLKRYQNSLYNNTDLQMISDLNYKEKITFIIYLYHLQLYNTKNIPIKLSQEILFYSIDNVYEYVISFHDKKIPIFIQYYLYHIVLHYKLFHENDKFTTTIKKFIIYNKLSYNVKIFKDKIIQKIINKHNINEELYNNETILTPLQHKIRMAFINNINNINDLIQKFYEMKIFILYNHKSINNIQDNEFIYIYNNNIYFYKRFINIDEDIEDTEEIFIYNEILLTYNID